MVAANRQRSACLLIDGEIVSRVWLHDRDEDSRLVNTTDRHGDFSGETAVFHREHFFHRIEDASTNSW